MKSIFSALALTAVVSLLAGCVVGSADETEDTAASEEALGGGGTLTCTNVDPALTNALKIVCDAAGTCALWSTPPGAATGTSYAMKVISAKGTKVTWSVASLGWKVVMTVAGSTPTYATVYEPTGVAATCQ